VVDLTRAGPDDALAVDRDRTHRLRQVRVPHNGECRASVGRPPEAAAARGDVHDVLGSGIGGDVPDAATDVARAELSPHLFGARGARARRGRRSRLRDRLVDGCVRNGAVGVGPLEVHPFLGPDRLGRGGRSACRNALRPVALGDGSGSGHEQDHEDRRGGISSSVHRYASLPGRMARCAVTPRAGA
jgi:hypothetical protein